MAENKMKEVAKLLEVDLNKPFRIKGYEIEFILTEEKGLISPLGAMYNGVLMNLLLGTNEIERPILTDKEKRYLEYVLKPFKDKIEHIVNYSFNNVESFIKVKINNCSYMIFPNFEKGTMYKGMKEYKEYTLKNLGLFEED